MMKQFNLALRFLLEITALIVSGIWGWNQSDGNFRYIMAAGIPVLFATLWGVFSVADDPSRKGKPVVAIPGWIRLILELLLFGFSSWAFFYLGHQVAGFIFVAFLLLHYFSYFERISWLLRQS